MYSRMAVAGILALALVLAAAGTYGREALRSLSRPITAETSEAPTARGANPREEARAAPGERPGSPSASSGDERERAARDEEPRPTDDSGGDRVGDFCYPDDVPYHGVSSTKEAGNELIKVLELVVRTRATSETDLTLLTRSFKAFYEDYDALVISFNSLSEKGEPAVGEAIVTNTVSGALILGLSDGPLNEEGMTVVSYVDPANTPQDEVFARTECS